MRNVDITYMIDRGKVGGNRIVQQVLSIFPNYCDIWVNMGNADERESKTEKVDPCGGL